MIPFVHTNVKLWSGIWKTWRTLPNNLASSIVGFNGTSYDFDFDKWYIIQATILEGILHTMKQGAMISYHRDLTKMIAKPKFTTLSTKKYYDILWTGWFPTICKREWYSLSNRQDFSMLVESSVWLGHTDTFIIFADNIDADFVTRFVRKEWSENDQFIAIAPIDDYPSWIVVSNHLNQKYLEEFLTSLIPK